MLLNRLKIPKNKQSYHKAKLKYKKIKNFRKKFCDNAA